jgi:SAM-dependent methyltransferase
LGIGSDIFEVLTKLRTAGYLHPHSAIMEIGAQQLSQDFLAHQQKLTQLASLFGVEQTLALPPPKPSHIVHGELMHLAHDALRARDFWLWLGFDYAAIDIDGSPGSIALDLNYDRVPASAAEKYDLVTNFGTTEHVANQLNAFKIIHDLTKPGGIMLHQLPAQGMLNHGLINYNLKFFWMLARSNGYKFVHARWQQSKVAYSPPSDIVDFLNANDLTATIPDFKVADAAFTIAMQKWFDIRFVAPIDVTTGSTTEYKKLRKRYWTVFDRQAFEEFQNRAMTPHRRDWRSLVASVRWRLRRALRQIR